jgi:hypothetical protein
MASENGGIGFGWGLVVGLGLGVGLGYYLASEAGREQVDVLRARTVELTGTARRAATDPAHPVRRAIQDGIVAARQRGEELARQPQGAWQRPSAVASDVGGRTDG